MNTQMWEQQRNNTVSAKNAHMAVVACERYQAAENGHKFDCTLLPFDESCYTPLQLELFATNPVDFEFIEQKLENLPRQRQREYFRKLYLKAYRSVKDDGSIAFLLGNKQRRHANDYLRNVLDVRLQKVFSQYNVNVDFLQAFINTPQWLLSVKDEMHQAVQFSTLPTREELAKHYNELHYSGFHFQLFGTQQKQKQLPFYLITESKLKKMAYEMATAFIRFQCDCSHFLKNGIESDNEGDIQGYFYQLYKWCGEIALSAGFKIPHWEKIENDKRIKAEHIDSTLIRLTCEKWWFKQMRDIQKRMVEHIAIACGEVRANAASYISNQSFQEWQLQQRKNHDYLRAMIIENIDNPEEQVELFDMFLKSSSNPALRRNEMMVRLRGLEEWAEENNNEALFLTLTAPSSFHAGNGNKKWSGVNPRDTQNYLNKVWQQFRALLSKRDIKFYGMRVAEPHKDGTPHWHALAYVPAEHKEEVIRLFKQKALELDGNEKGAAEHRCKVEECDKTKGSATAYIAKYIAKNIDGFALAGEVSDEDPTLSLHDNALRVRAWASRWGIRQFQFYGGASICVWRELRRLISGQADDEIINKAQAAAGIANDYAAYMEIQGGALAKRTDQPIKLDYETKPANKYGEQRKAIIGLANRFSLKQVISRTKKWQIKKRPQDFAQRTESMVERSSTANNSARSAPWTCVSNCNRSILEQKIKLLTQSICAPLSAQKLDYLFKYKRLIIDKYTAIELTENDVQLVKRNQNMMTSLSPVPSLRNLKKLKDFHKNQRIQ
ncbi:TPA: replication endonuclease [Haemophilus influenzae]|uniref:replication endonuclease n=1 Tax=Haemophilus influenzae TaxID=727 RepID=UPI000D01948E|nr:replication endonuclease [Haemophilus influenzae]PRM07708.1 Bacteriophage replication gene A protein [Haemophilus influenzae]PRM10788.1 Bacteriophage replication gene A protein [Haemophilus influenzae]